MLGVAELGDDAADADADSKGGEPRPPPGEQCALGRQARAPGAAAGLEVRYLGDRSARPAIELLEQVVRGQLDLRASISFSA